MAEEFTREHRAHPGEHVPRIRRPRMGSRPIVKVVSDLNHRIAEEATPVVRNVGHAFRLFSLTTPRVFVACEWNTSRSRVCSSLVQTFTFGILRILGHHDDRLMEILSWICFARIGIPSTFFMRPKRQMRFGASLNQDESIPRPSHVVDSWSISFCNP